MKVRRKRSRHKWEERMKWTTNFTRFNNAQIPQKDQLLLMYYHSFSKQSDESSLFVMGSEPGRYCREDTKMGKIVGKGLCVQKRAGKKSKLRNLQTL